MSEIKADLMEGLTINDEQYCLYGDLAYSLRAFLNVLYSGVLGSLTQGHSRFNASMPRARTPVEWRCEDIREYFAPVDFNTMMMVALVPIATLFVVSAILWNFRLRFYGSQSAQFLTFNLPLFTSTSLC